MLSGYGSDAAQGHRKESSMGTRPFISRDVEELVTLFVKHEVDFVLVGGHAVVTKSGVLGGRTDMSTLPAMGCVGKGGWTYLSARGDGDGGGVWARRRRRWVHQEVGAIRVSRGK